MDRRGFIKLGIAGGGVAATPGCAVPPRDPRTPGDLAPFFTQLDAALVAISKWAPLKQLVSNAASDQVAAKAKYSARDEELVRNSLRAMIIAGSFRDLSDEDRHHPGMQSRIEKALPEMEEALFGMVAHLESISLDRGKAIRAKLQADPEVPLRIAEVVDHAAEISGVSSKRRIHLRALTLQVGFRLRTQPLATFTDEVRAKIKTVAERQKAKHTAMVNEAVDREPVASRAAAGGSSAKTHATVNTAAILLGLGMAGTAAGVGIGGAGLFLATVGVLTVLAGLITLIIGLILEAVD